MKLPKKLAPLIRAVLMGIMMPLVMTCFITVMNYGFKSGFFALWMKNFGLAFVIAFPLIIFLSPLIGKFVNSITE